MKQPLFIIYLAHQSTKPKLLFVFIQIPDIVRLLFQVAYGQGAKAAELLVLDTVRREIDWSY